MPLKAAIPGNYTLVATLLEQEDQVLYRVKRNEDGQKALLKFVFGDNNLQALPRLQHEYNLLQNATSEFLPGAVALQDVPPRPYLLLKDADGVPLRSLIDSAGLDIAGFLRFAVLLARALDNLHKQQVLLNNLNPAGIIYHQGRGQLKLIDLQKAGHLAIEQTPVFGTKMRTGNLEYISPEQTGRMNRRIDYRSDYYAMGILLYEILTGKPPFRSPDPLEIVHAHIALLPAAPAQLSPGIPQSVSDIVLKLIAKNAEERYQSMAGLIADLDLCLQQWTRSQSIEIFEIGRHDHFDVLNIPQKLYGREREIELLHKHFKQTAAGHTGFITVSGYSGIGKTTLVHEIYGPLAREKGYFVAGKFDQLNRNIPYLPLLDALRDLVKMILTEPDQRVQGWKKEIEKKLGPNAKVICEVVPELELIVGKLPAVQKLPAAEAQTRFNTVFSDFIGVFARPAHPLVLMLDDVQWADPASLNFLEQLLQKNKRNALLILCAYRDNLVDAHHPFIRVLNTLRDARRVTAEISLQVLTATHVQQLLAETLHLPLPDVLPLADLIHGKTQGNPFFIRQFLNTLVESKKLVYRAQDGGGWTWELNEISKLSITENVVQFLTQKMAALPEPAKLALQLAACIGNAFDLKTLALVAEAAVGKVGQDLWQPLVQGLIVPDSDDYKYLAEGDDRQIGMDLSIRYRFLHDRVQQAAFALIPETEIEAVHYRIGKHLLQTADQHTDFNRIFDMLYHLNQSTGFITSDEERIALARLNLQAGKKAKNSAAFEAAHAYFEYGYQLLKDRDREQQYKLCWSLYNELSETAYIIGQFDQAEAYFETVLDFSRTPLEQAKILTTKVKLYTHINKIQDALQTGIRAAQLLQLTIPESPGKLRVGFEFLKTRLQLARRSIRALPDLPEMRNRPAKAAIELLSQMATAAYFTSPEMIGFLNLKMMQLVIRHGNPESAPFVYSQYALLEGAGAGAYRKAFELGSLAVDLTRSGNTPFWKARTYLTMGAIINHWQKPLPTNLPILAEAYQAAIESGDLLYSVYANRFTAHTKISMGTDLPELLTEVERYVEFEEKTRHNTFDMIIYRRMLRTLQGAAADEQDARHDGTPFLEQIRAAKDISAEIQYFICRIKSHFFMQDYEQAADLALEAEPAAFGSFGQLLELEYRFFSTLAMARLMQSAQPAKQKRLKSKMHRHMRRIRRWADNCPQNFNAHYYLVLAEWNRILGRPDPEVLYQKAAAAALDAGMIHIAAVAEAAAADYHFQKHHPKRALLNLIDAIYHFEQWGALAVSRRLREDRAELLEQFDDRYLAILSGAQKKGASMSSVLDVDTLIQSSQAIAGEIDLQQLVDKIMQIVITNAGAGYGLLMLTKENGLYVEAKADARQPQKILSVPFEEFQEVAHSVVRYVQRSEQALVLDNAREDDRFQDDPHLGSNDVRSVLCQPIINQGNLRGILYLENNLTSKAFSPERVELLNVLSNEMAVSIENAILYGQLKQANAQLEQHSRQLEQKVQARTKDLQQRSDQLAATNRELEATLDRLKNTQEQLVQSEKMASLGELTAGIAHEIKNPLNFVNNFAESSGELLAELEENLQTVQAHFDAETAEDTKALLADISMNLTKIAEHGTRADGIIHSMMLHARGSDGKKESTDINALLEESVNLVYHGMRAQNPDFAITLHRDFDPAVGRLQVFAQDLNRVFLNLINNGCYAAYEGHRNGLPGPAELSVTSRALDDRVEIVIRDNGPGIAPEAIEKIFNPFYTTKPAGKGTGLGLSISYDIIDKKHKGSISVQSEKDEYTAFTVALPREQ